MESNFNTEVSTESSTTENEVQELVSYIMGSLTEPPKSLEKMMTNLYQKLQTGLGYSIASNVKRQTKLARFIAAAEEELYDPEQVSLMEREDLEKAYSSASKSLSEMNEFERRFLAQNKESFTAKRTEQEDIAAKLMTLPSDKIESIMKIINGEALLTQEDVEL
jgi:hypothetical protein